MVENTRGAAGQGGRAVHREGEIEKKETIAKEREEGTGSHCGTQIQGEIDKNLKMAKLNRMLGLESGETSLESATFSKMVPAPKETPAPSHMMFPKNGSSLRGGEMLMTCKKILEQM